MNKSHRKTAIIIVTIIFCFSLNHSFSFQKDSIILPLVSKNYTLSNPIEITSDSDFSSFNGSGAIDDPYLIEGLNITTTKRYGIHVSYTTKYFAIVNCYVSARLAGICVEYVVKGTAAIVGNICKNSYETNGKGIVLFFCPGSSVMKNICSDNQQLGIYLAFSTISFISNNLCNNNGEYGMVIHYSNSSFITQNICNENSDYGIYFAGSDESYITHNTCSKNKGIGLVLDYSSFSILINNTLDNNSDCGIVSLETDNCTFNYNWLQNHKFHGFYLNENCNGNEIYYNNFVNNNLNGNSQAMDEGLRNLWCNDLEQIGNYWSNLEGKKSYLVDGEGNSVDYYPRKNPFKYESFSNGDTKETSFGFVSSIIGILVYFKRSKKEICIKKEDLLIE